MKEDSHLKKLTQKRRYEKETPRSLISVDARGAVSEKAARLRD